MEAGEFTAFPFIALNPKGDVSVKYKAYVTYEDGVVVPFDGSEEAKGYQPTIHLRWPAPYANADSGGQAKLSERLLPEKRCRTRLGKALIASLSEKGCLKTWIGFFRRPLIFKQTLFSLSGCISILNRRFYVPLAFQEYFKAASTSHFSIPAYARMTAAG